MKDVSVNDLIVDIMKFVLLPKTIKFILNKVLNLNMKKPIKSIQTNLFIEHGVIVEPTLKLHLTSEEKLQRQEKIEARRAWKILKSKKGKNLLTDRDKILLKRHYNIDIK